MTVGLLSMLACVPIGQTAWYVSVASADIHIYGLCKSVPLIGEDLWILFPQVCYLRNILVRLSSLCWAVFVASF